MNRLLVMSCSDRKSTAPGNIPAWERYTGPSYQIAKKILKENNWHTQGIFILSAKFGLITPETLIPNYDVKMTTLLAEAHRPKTVERLRDIVMVQKPNEIFLFLSSTYSLAVLPVSHWAGNTPYCFARAPMGYRNRFLKDWFLGRSVVTPLGLVDVKTQNVLIRRLR